MGGPGNYGRCSNLGVVLPAQPHAERDHDGEGQCKPGDGVLQVIVLEMDGKRAGLWNAALGHRAFSADCTS